jgi:hypothetical protein
MRTCQNSISFIRSGGVGLLTVRRLKANWLATPTVTTVTRCLSSRTIVNCRDRQQNAQVSDKNAMHCNAMQGECNVINKFHIPYAMGEL